MFKQIIALLLLSVIVVLAMPYAQVAIHLLLEGHATITRLLADVFAGSQTGTILKGLLALLVLPLLLALIPAIIYWFVRKRWLPCFMEIVWVIWLLQAGALIADHQTTAVSSPTNQITILKQT